MGLCKCPRKKVTNLFCFEHRVNVCEHCLVEKHETCVVQSYLAWLQDSDFDASCPLCSKPLSSAEVVRLQCYHLCHWHCLDEWAKRFPANTAPAGFRCPTCHEHIFPKPNQVSPVIDKLRAVLNRANWARAGLGLPLLPELDAAAAIHSQSDSNRSGGRAVVVENGISHSKQQTAVSVDESYGGGGGGVGGGIQESFTTARKPAYTANDDYGASAALLKQTPGSRDEDLPENKYKRRSALEWFRRWLHSRSIMHRGADPLRGYKRTFFLLLIAIIGLMTLITILTRVVHEPSAGDPLLDPLANPNIRINPVGAGDDDSRVAH